MLEADRFTLLQTDCYLLLLRFTLAGSVIPEIKTSGHVARWSVLQGGNSLPMPTNNKCFEAKANEVTVESGSLTRTASGATSLADKGRAESSNYRACSHYCHILVLSGIVFELS